MKTKILDLIKTDHDLYKQWTYGLSDMDLMPIVSRIEAPEGTRKKIVFVVPQFLISCGISKSKKNAMVLVLKGKRIVTKFFSDHPNYLFKKEKEADFQIIYY
jgi:hypothetical protein